MVFFKWLQYWKLWKICWCYIIFKSNFKGENRSERLKQAATRCLNSDLKSLCPYLLSFWETLGSKTVNFSGNKVDEIIKRDYLEWIRDQDLWIITFQKFPSMRYHPLMTWRSLRGEGAYKISVWGGKAGRNYFYTIREILSDWNNEKCSKFLLPTSWVRV